ncbi:hypothetical protein QMK33_03325 [Hymenobacter sp. H14-R3]|uniref:hypothetical protein n=1 Tax=Hymenobacter sp. H14-R3 TaxID=3046308 RepID=UPI0024B9AC08|nr:hypothetical protein [Hymenobacter sp. H14-R3]MDJ0364170.1 hypothetical protein [Hymenobacter sp. H14-R3]
MRFCLPRTARSILISANALVLGIDPKVAAVGMTQGLKGGKLLVSNPTENLTENLTEGLAVSTRLAPRPKTPAGPPPAKPRTNRPRSPPRVVAAG